MIYKYTKKKGKFTIHELRGEGVQELATIDGETYAYGPSKLEPQSPEIAPVAVTLDSELRAKLKQHSPQWKRINERVVERIRKRYSLSDELELLRGSKLSTAFKAYNDYVEECRAWGNKLKSMGGNEDVKPILQILPDSKKSLI